MIRTIKVNDDKIKVETRMKTRSGNPMGFKVLVNECEYHFNVLTHQEAMDSGFSKYVKENR